MLMFVTWWVGCISGIGHEPQQCFLGRQNAGVSKKKRIKGRKDTFRHFLNKKLDNLIYFGNKNHEKTIVIVGGWGQKRPKTC